MILVTGATGNAGSQVVRVLRQRGERVRAFVRDPEKGRRLLGADVELAIGDFADTSSVAAALEGVEAMVLSCGADPRRVDWESAAVDAAVEAGASRIVRMSSIGAEPGSPVAFWDWLGRVDEHLRSSDVGWVVLQSSFYMSNLLADAKQVVDEGWIAAPLADARIAMIDPLDVGAAVAAAVRGGHDGTTLVLTGPEALTYEDVARALAAVSGRDVGYVAASEEEARQGMLDAGVPEAVAAMLLEVFRELRNGVAAGVTEDFSALTGRPPRTLDAFLAEHAALFRRRAPALGRP